MASSLRRPGSPSFDKRPTWAVQTSHDDDEFVFCHDDVAMHNILSNPETLEVEAVVDWENAGYFPRAFRQWCSTDAEYKALFEDREMLSTLVSLLEI
jgi:aminoglycoside phosphotransferase (APT) family kinase protein